MKYLFSKYFTKVTYAYVVAFFCFVEVYIQDKFGHPRWLSGPLMFKLPKSRGEIPLGFPPIL